MVKEQAHLFFPHSPEDDLEDLWEQRFFEQKQFFLTHPPMRKVWEARIKRLTQQYDAYLALTDQTDISDTTEEAFEENINFPEGFIASFHEFHTLRNQHKSKLLQAQTLKDLNKAIKSWLNTEKQFAKHWAYPACEEDEVEVVRSKEPDPMDLLKDLKTSGVILCRSK